jgi:hypothetical protein
VFPSLTVEVTPVVVKEIVYQAVPYVGMAKVLDFIHATRELQQDDGKPHETEPARRLKIIISRHTRGRDP